MDRLQGQWPDVAAVLASLDAVERRRVAARAAAHALEVVDLGTPEGDEQAVTAQLQQLDVIAWQIQDDDTAPAGAYETAFRRARAVNAYALSRFGGSPDDALYEALHALGAPSDAGSVLGL
ncbi:hypothetical protein [Cellulomonas xiejunii]|uniref:hypothetical protein n=1 Tax=Cellulomonas xiejunii TaxID=2968083 RepID=UPI001D0E4854|nr:hypothetical protein [Cellulomonas xiejunii]MCC2315001.1 hypothetical protein [Cellulomonas xiejunii]